MNATYLSKRFILERYLQLTDDEIINNERMLREEKGLDPDSDDDSELPTLYNPEAAAEMGGGLGMEAGGELGGEMTAGGGGEIGGGEAGGELGGL